MKDNLSPGARIWINGKEGTFMGEGRAELLRHIDSTGSINEASKKMNMSYKKALKLIDTMNSQLNENLVESESGGKGGGGTKLTEKGKKALEIYLELKKRCDHYLEVEFNKLIHDF